MLTLRSAEHKRHTQDVIVVEQQRASNLQRATSKEERYIHSEREVPASSPPSFRQKATRDTGRRAAPTHGRVRRGCMPQRRPPTPNGRALPKKANAKLRAEKTQTHLKTPSCCSPSDDVGVLALQNLVQLGGEGLPVPLGSRECAEGVGGGS